MARRRGQHPNVLKTAARRARWYFRYSVPVLVGPGQIKDVERIKYLGLCKEQGKREAEKQRDEFLATINDVEALIPSQIRFAEVLRRYRVFFMPTLRPNSQINVEHFIAKHIEPVFGHLRLCDIDALAVQAWMNSKAGMTKSSRATLLSWMRSILEQAAVWGLTQQRNPAAKIRIGDGGGKERDLRALTVDELRRLIHVSEDRPPLADMVRVAAFCGLRIGEIRGLQWGDVGQGTLRVRCSLSQRTSTETGPKTETGRRIVPLPFELVKPLDAKDSDRVFDVERTSNFGLTWAGKRAGLTFRGFGWHTLRRTYATLMDQHGAQGLEDSMGHTKHSMTERYIRRTFEQHADVADRIKRTVQ